MVDKLDEMETKLNEQIERNVGLNARLNETTAQTILNNVVEGLAVSQKDKLANLAEGVEFESEEAYREKLTTLKESYFGSKAASSSDETVQLKEEAEHVEPATGSMATYLQIPVFCSQKVIVNFKVKPSRKMQQNINYNALTEKWAYFTRLRWSRSN